MRLREDAWLELLVGALLLMLGRITDMLGVSPMAWALDTVQALNIGLFALKLWRERNARNAQELIP